MDSEKYGNKNGNYCKKNNKINMSENIKIKTFVNNKDWNKFVDNHPHGNIFQTSDMAEVYKRTRNYEPISLAAINEKDEILAFLLAFVRYEMSGTLGSFSAHSIIQGGPLFVEDERGVDALKVLMIGYDKIACKKVLYTEIRNMWDTSAFCDVFNEMGYEFEDHLNFLVDLTKPKEVLWSNLSKSKRRFIKKARQEGVIIEEIKDRNLVPIFYGLLRQTYRNAKIPLADISLFESAFDILMPKKLLKLFMAKYGDEYIGGIMCPIYKEVITEWYVAGSREHSKLYPSELVTWHPIEWGLENGYQTFDFLGAGKPNKEYGVRDFKKQFGGKLVNYGRYIKVHSPIKMKIARIGFGVYRRICIRR